MINPDRSFVRLAGICAAGIVLNVVCSALVKGFNLPIYFDTFGTVFIAVIGGYVPGIAVGFFTNLFAAKFDIEEMYFGFVSILVAIISAFLANKGYYEKFSKVIMTIPATALITAFFGALIDEMLKPVNSFDSLGNFVQHYLNNFSIEMLDKGLAILAAFFLLKIIPLDIKKDFRLMGKMQAPIPDEMRKAMSTKNSFISSLRTKMIINLMSITLIVAVSICAISYKIYQDSAVKERIRIADGIITMAVNEINPNRVDEYLQLGHQAEGYNEVENMLYKIRASNSDIKFIYVYKIMEDGCHVVFDLDTATVEASPPGDIQEFDESFEPLLDDLLAGRPIKPIITDDTYGYLLTIYKPVYNYQGQCVCYAGIDFSMDLISDYGRTFISKVIAIFSGAVIFIFVLGLSFIENNIILPVNTMAYCAKNFSYDSVEARESNVERMRELNIKTHDEIENLYAAFLKTTADSMHYFENFKRAQIQVAVMDELAHKDALTGLRNKTAYVEKTNEFDAAIGAGTAEFAIIMIDVNFLKKVNDTYGHEYGNIYLINAGKLACSVFGEENVYRVGGDEFVAVLDGENFSRCEELVTVLRGMIEKFKTDKTLEAWEKVSAAVGVAYYQAGVDTCAEEVFKRADADMYKNKLAMKATRKD